MKRKGKAAPIDFDVAEFLRPTDTDLKSAIHTLLGTTAADAPLKLDPPLNLEAPTNLVAAPILRAPANIEPLPNYSPSFESGLKLDPPPIIEPASKLEGGPKLDYPRLQKPRTFAIREARSASDGHSRAEEQVYQTLWQQAELQGDGSRLIQIGYLALARLVGLSESNARINLRSLERKLAVEEFAPYICEQSQGRTWRIFSPGQILERRAVAGLRFYMKRTLAVVFVDPRTGQRLLD